MLSYYSALFSQAAFVGADLGTMVYYGEALVWLLELGVLANNDLVQRSLQNDNETKDSSSNLYAVFQNLQLNNILFNITNSTTIWVAVFGLFFALCMFLYLNILSIKRQLKDYTELGVNHSNLTKNASSFRINILHMWEYIFFPVALLANSFCTCESRFTQQKLSNLPEDIPVISEAADMFKAKLESVYKLIWKYNRDEMCFGGIHLLVILLCSVVHCINFMFLVLSHSLTSFYPTKRMMVSKRNLFWIIHPLLVVALSIFKISLSMTVSQNIPIIYFYTALVIMMLLIIIELVIHPFHNNKLLAIHIISKSLLLAIICYVSTSDLDNIPMASRSYLFKMIPILLCLAAILKFVSYFFASDQPFRGFHPNLTTLSPTDLVFSFEQLKHAICFHPEAALQGPETLSYVLNMLSLHHSHKAACVSPSCFCRSKQRNILAAKLDEVFGRRNPVWLVDVLCIIDYILLAHIERLKSSTDLIEVLQLWSVFTITNFGDTSRVLRLLNRVHTLSPSSRRSVSYESDWSEWKRMRLSTIRCIVLSHIGQFNHLPSLLEWDSSFAVSLLPKRRSTNTKRTISELSKVSQPVQFINLLQILGAKIESAYQCKIRLIEQLAQNPMRLNQISKSLTSSSVVVDAILSRLESESTTNFYKLQHLRLFYLLFVKEQHHKVTRLIRSLTSAKIPITVNLHQLAKCSNNTSQLCVLGA